VGQLCLRPLNCVWHGCFLTGLLLAVFGPDDSVRPVAVADDWLQREALNMACSALLLAQSASSRHKLRFSLAGMVCAGCGA
jgi:hypothetical protein